MTTPAPLPSSHFVQSKPEPCGYEIEKVLDGEVYLVICGKPSTGPNPTHLQINAHALNPWLCEEHKEKLARDMAPYGKRAALAKAAFRALVEDSVGGLWTVAQIREYLEIVMRDWPNLLDDKGRLVLDKLDDRGKFPKDALMLFQQVRAREERLRREMQMQSEGT